MASKQVIDRERSSRAVVATLEQYADEAGQGAGAALDELLARGERKVDVAVIVRLVGRMLTGTTASLVEADREHERELAGDSQAREQRDVAHRELYQLVVVVRNAVLANFGEVGAKTLGIGEPCPSDAQGTLSYAAGLVASLKERDATMPKPRTPNVRFERAALAIELSGKVDALSTSMAAVAREDSAAKGTQARKDAAMAAFDRAFRIATSVGTSLFLLAGMDEIADRIKPSTRRAGQLEHPSSPPDGGDERESPSAPA